MLAYLGLQNGQNIFQFLKINVIDAVKKEPYVADAEVKRILPNTVQIKVKERRKKFYIQFLNSYAAISSQGYVLEMVNSIDQEIPLIKGISTAEENVTPGNRLDEKDLRKLETAIKIMNTFKDNNLDNLVTSIDISNESEYTVLMEKEQKIIHLGDKTDLSNKIRYVQAILDKNKNVAGDIFVNGDFNNKFKAYFRMKV